MDDNNKYKKNDEIHKKIHGKKIKPKKIDKPGPTLFRICAIIIYATLDILIPTALLYAEYDQNLNNFVNQEFLSGYNITSSGIDISFICFFRALLTAVFGFFLGLWMPIAFTVHIVAIILLIIKSIVVSTSWWNGYRTAIFICSLIFGFYQLRMSWKMRKVVETLDKKVSTTTFDDVESGNMTTTSDSEKNKDDEKEDSSSIERLLMLAKPEKYLLLVGTIALVFANIATLIIPALFGQLINLLAQSKSIEQGEIELSNIVISLIIWVIIMAFFTFLRGWLYTLAGERLVARFRKQLFDKIAHHDISFFDKIQSGELVNRLASDTNVVQNAVTVNISMALRFTGQGMIGLVIIFLISPKLTGLMFTVVPVVMVFAVCYGRYLKKIGKKYQESLAKAGEIATEVIGNMRTVRSFGRENMEHGRYSNAIMDSFKQGRARAFVYGSFAGTMGLLSYTAITTVLWYGGTLVIRGEMKPGTLISFLLYTIFIASALGALTSVFGQLMTAVGSSDRLFEILDLEPEINSYPNSGGRIPNIINKASGIVVEEKDHKEEKSINKSYHVDSSSDEETIKGEITFTNVNFSYPSRRDISVLNNVSFKVKEGENVAICGQSGAGKSTIIQLIERFYLPTNGSIKISSFDINSLDHGFLHSNISLVSQEPILFATSIRENILYGIDRDVPMLELIEVAKKANAHKFITGFPEGYDTLVGERGVQLSGGQKQRVAIARAILMNPLILLLDEATSALDAESEGVVQDALDQLMLNRTTIVIAHRLSTIKNAHTIMVMHDGAIVEKASGDGDGNSAHNQLLSKTNGLYYELVKKQLSGLQDKEKK